MLALLFACHSWDFEDRVAGDRSPVSQTCDDADPVRCLLPWPSNTFTVEDASTETGLRIDVQAEALGADDDPSFLNLGNGFSRATAVVTAFEEVPPHPGARDSLENDHLFVFNVQPDSPNYGRSERYWTEWVDTSNISADRSLLIGRPVGVLEPDTDYLVVVLDRIGSTSEVPHGTRVILGLDEPGSEIEAQVAAYHAPSRAFLDEQGIAPEEVLRVWDFTTRSATDPTWRTHAMMEALDGAIGDIGVEIDSVALPSHPAVDAVVRGRLTGAPSFLTGEGMLSLDGEGRPEVVGTQDIEFRLSLPAGDPEVPFRVGLYGHGTGGNVSDSSFDEDMAEYDIAKLNLRFDGWTDEDFVATLADFNAFLEGSERSTAGLMQSIAGGTMLITALDGVLGELIADIELSEGVRYGRSPNTSQVVWMGGSLGGTLGAVIVSADPRLQVAVLNVPGAGWSHLIPHSLLYHSGMESVLLNTYGDVLDVQHAIVMGQGSWDDVDGAVWADEALAAGGAFLLQEVMEDPVLPNMGTDILASALGAKQIEPYLYAIPGLESSSEVLTSGAALEQYRVPDGLGVYQHHGFAARDTVAGDAALEQILEFLEQAWDGQTPMSHPDLCWEFGLDGTCDFSQAWEPE